MTERQQRKNSSMAAENTQLSYKTTSCGSLTEDPFVSITSALK